MLSLEKENQAMIGVLIPSIVYDHSISVTILEMNPWDCGTYFDAIGWIPYSNDLIVFKKKARS